MVERKNKQVTTPFDKYQNAEKAIEVIKAFAEEHNVPLTRVEFNYNYWDDYCDVELSTIRMETLEEAIKREELEAKTRESHQNYERLQYERLKAKFG